MLLCEFCRKTRLEKCDTTESTVIRGFVLPVPLPGPSLRLAAPFSRTTHPLGNVVVSRRVFMYVSFLLPRHNTFVFVRHPPRGRLIDFETISSTPGRMSRHVIYIVYATGRPGTVVLLCSCNIVTKNGRNRVSELKQIIPQTSKEIGMKSLKL